MNDWIGFPLAISIVLCIGWVITRFCGVYRFSKYWHVFMAGTQVVLTLTMAFRVIDFGEMFSVVLFGALWFYLWLVLVIAYALKKRGKDIGLLFLYVVLSFIVARASNLITKPQGEGALQTGDLIVERLLEFRNEKGDWPESLADLQAFDGLEIPESGVGLWGDRQYFYSKDDENDTMTLRFTGFVGVSHWRHSDDARWFQD